MPDSSTQNLLDYLQDQLGKPYVSGATGPDSFDCSGLTYTAYKETCNIDLPRISTDQWSTGSEVDRNNIQVGDLVFFDTGWTDRVPNHTGVYIGNGKFINANSYNNAVVEDSLDSNYWNDAFYGIKRLIEEASIPSGGGDTSSTSDNTNTENSSNNTTEDTSNIVASIGSTQTTILQKGSQGSEVTELQKLLNKYGYTTSTSGSFDENTENAVTEFQITYELIENMGDSITGKFEEKTRDSLENIENSPFADVELTDDHARYIIFLNKKDVIEGYNDGTFLAENEINRAEALKMIFEAYKLQTSTSGTNPFIDVKNTDWFFPYVLSAYNNEYVNGYEENEQNVFKPANPITRAESSKIIIEITDLSISDEVIEFFEDVKSTDWFYSYIHKSANCNMLEANGVKIEPNRSITRGEMCQAIVRSILFKDFGLK